MLGIVDNTEEKSQKDQVVTASKPSKPLLTWGGVVRGGFQVTTMSNLNKVAFELL